MTVLIPDTTLGSGGGDGGGNGGGSSSSIELFAEVREIVGETHYTGLFYDEVASEATSHAWNSDGTALYFVSESSGTIDQYSLLLSFDLSGGVTNTGKSFVISDEESTPTGLVWNSDGSKFFIIGTDTNAAYEYTVSIPYDIGSSVAYSNNSFSVSGETTTPAAIRFNTDGTKIFVLGGEDTEVFEYPLATGFDLSTAGSTSASYAVSGQMDVASGLYFSTDGSKMFLLGADDFIFEYLLSTEFDLSDTVVYSGEFFELAQVGTDISSPLTSLTFNASGSRFYSLNTDSGVIYEFRSEGDFNIGSPATFNGNIVTLLETALRDMKWSNDGFKLFTLDNTGDLLRQYSASIPFRFTGTITYDSISFTVENEENNPKGFAWNDDGSKFFVVGAENETVYEYVCGTEFDLSTASYNNESASVSDANVPSGLAFNTDGTKLFIVDSQSARVYEYSVGTGFDMSSSVTQITFFDAGFQATSPQGVVFNPDGDKMFVTSQSGSNDKIYEYTLAAAFDLASIVTYTGESVNVRGQDTHARNIAWSGDGRNFIMAGQDTNSFYEYDVLAPYELTNLNVILTEEDNGVLLRCITTSEVSIKLPNSLNLSDDWRIGVANVDGLNDIRVGVQAMDTVNGSMDLIIQDVQYDIHTYVLDKSEHKYTVSGFAEATEEKIGKIQLATQDEVDGGINDTHALTPLTLDKWAGLPDKFVPPLYNTVLEVHGATNYSGYSHGVTNQDSSPEELTWNNDGSKFYILGNENNTIYEYDVSNPFNLNLSVKYRGNFFAIGGQEITPTGMVWNDDGFKFYIIGTTNATVYEYECTIAFDITSAQYSGDFFSVSSQEATPEGIAFNAVGNKFFIVGLTNATIYEYTLSIPFNIGSVVVYSTKSFDVSNEEADPSSLRFNTDGTRLFLLGTAEDSLHEYSLTNGFDLTTDNIVFTGESFSVGGQEIDPHGLALSSDGTKFFIVGTDDDTVYQYNMASAFTLGEQSTYSGNSHSVLIQDSTPRAMAWNNDGTKFFMLGSENNRLYEYHLTNPYDLSSGVSFSNNSHSVNAQEPSPTGVAFNANGTKFFVIGTNHDIVFEYDLTTAFSLLSGVTYSGNSFGTNSEDPVPEDISFNTDGTSMFIVGNNTNRIHEYTLTIGFDITTASYSNNFFSVVSQANNPTGMAWTPDGTKFILSGAQTNSVFEYTVATPFDLSSQVDYTGENVYVGTQDTAVEGVTWNDDGTKFFTVGHFNDAIYEYDTPIPYELAGVVLSLTQAEDGYLIRCNTASGPIDIQLPDSSTLTDDWRCGVVVKDNTSDVEVAVIGNDTVNGATDVITQTMEHEIVDYVLDQSEGEYVASGLSSAIFRLMTPSVKQVFEPINFGVVVSNQHVLTDGFTYQVEQLITLISTALGIPNDANIKIEAPTLIGTDIFYTGTAVTLFKGLTPTDGIDQLHLNRMSIVTAASSHQSLDVEGLPPAQTSIGLAVLLIEHMVLAFFETLGSIKNFGICNIDDLVFSGYTNGLTLRDMGSLRIQGTGFLSGASATGPSVIIEGGAAGIRLIDNTYRTGNVAGSAIRIDPAIPDDSNIEINGSIMDGASKLLFDTSGADGTFTVAEDAAISSTTISTVASGTAVVGGNRASFLSAADVHVNQIVTLVDYSTNTDYNVTKRCVTSDLGVSFELEGVLFGTSESGGSVSGDATKLTDTGTSLVDGDTIMVDTDGAIDYDGGSYVFAKDTDDFQINREFTSTQTGSWSTRGRDQTDSRVIAFNNSGLANSRYVASLILASNAATSSFSSTPGPLTLTGLNQGSVMERFKLLDAETGEMIYTGNEPIDAFIGFQGVLIGQGAAQTYSIEYYKNTGSGWVQLADTLPAMTASIGNVVVGTYISVGVPVSLVKGDRLRPQGFSVATRTPVVEDFHVSIGR